MNPLTSSPCPDRDQIQKLLCGQASEDEFEKLEEHLLQCDQCSKEADALIPSDEVTEMLSRAETQVFRSREVEFVEQLIHRVRLLRTLRTEESASGVEQTVVNTNAPDQNSRIQIDHKQRDDQQITEQHDRAAVAEPNVNLEMLGCYRILEVLGAGGMGTVYRAEDLQLRRQVALKVMKPSIAANPEAKSRFLREAEATAAIEHDNIVTIYQVGEDRGVPFIAMQFLKGESLQSRLERCGRLTESQTLSMARQIAAGLDAAHRQGLIHRDIKPDNIWLQEGSDRVRILDFGLVRNNADDTSLTQSGIVLGTPRYMSPEQARGDVVDHRCDLFSLGSVMYRMLAGKGPFEGNNLTATLMAVTHNDPLPLRQLSPDVSPGINDLIFRLLAKSPANRPQTAMAVIEEIDRLQQSDLHPAMTDPDTPDPPVVATANASTRPPFVRTAISLLGSIAVFALLAALIVRFRTKEGVVVIELDSAVPVGQVEIDGSRVQFSLDASGRVLTMTVPEGTHDLQLNTIDGVSLTTELGSKPVEVSISETTRIRAWLEESKQADVRPSSPAEIAPRWPSGPLPTWATANWLWTRIKDGHVIPGAVERPTSLDDQHRWNVDSIQSRGAVTVARYSPDGRWLATGSTDGHVRIYDAVSMKIRQLLPGVGGSPGVADLSWHPDSLRIAVAADNRHALRIWTREGELLMEDAGDVNHATAVAWTFDGSRLICGGDQSLCVRDSNGGLISNVSASTISGCDIGNISVSPDSQRFVCWHWDKARIWNAESLQPEKDIEISYQQSTGGHRVRWSSDHRLSFSQFDRTLICSVDGVIQQELLSEGLAAIAWHPDGRRLTLWRWDLFNIDGETGVAPEPSSRMILPPDLPTVPTAISWSPDGKKIALAAGRLAICNDDLNSVEFDTGAFHLPVSGLAINCEGGQLASVSQIGDDCVRLWSSDGASLKALPLDEMAFPAMRVACSPVENRIVSFSRQSSRIRIFRPDGSHCDIPGPCQNAAWNPDGTRLAIGRVNGHVQIFDSEANIINDINLNEASTVTGNENAGPVLVAWSSTGTLVAHVGQRLFRIKPDQTPAFREIAELSNLPDDKVPVWRPNTEELSLAFELHVNAGFEDIAATADATVRHARDAAAWSPDGQSYLHLRSGFLLLCSPDGSERSHRGQNSSHLSGAGAWHPERQQIYVGHDQSLLTARNARSLQVDWSAILLPEHQSITFDAGGSVLSGHRHVLDQMFLCYMLDPTGNVKVMTPTEFEVQTGREFMVVPERSFYAEHGLTLITGNSWRNSTSDAEDVPGTLLTHLERPGGVSMDLFIQETGGPIDPAWMLAEQTRIQKEMFSATIVSAEVKTIAELPAMSLVVSGNGNGSVIDGTGAVPTTQHWIAIPRGHHVIGARLTSPSGIYSESESAFLEAINTLQLRQNPQP